MSRLGVRLLTIARALAVRTTARPRARPVSRILVAHHLLLGDTLLLAPLLKKLAALHPDAERVVLARPAVLPLFERRPYGFTALSFDPRDPRSQRRVIDSGPYDLAIVPDDNRYAWLAKAAGARTVVAFADDRPAWKNWVVDRPLPYPATPAAWADLAAATLCAEGGPPEPFDLGEWPQPDHAPFERPDAPYAVLHVGASTPLKQWPADRWRRLADRLVAQGLVVVWTGGAAERPILDAVGPRTGEHDLVGRLDLAQLWELLARADRCVCPDTGIAHLARLVGVQTVALFGPGSAAVHGPGTFWARAPFAVATVTDFPCRDRHTLYRREVPWVRRCGRRHDPAALPAGASVPDACGRALCMEAIDESVVARLARTE